MKIHTSIRNFKSISSELKPYHSTFQANQGNLNNNRKSDLSSKLLQFNDINLILSNRTPKSVTSVTVENNKQSEMHKPGIVPIYETIILSKINENFKEKTDFEEYHFLQSNHVLRLDVLSNNNDIDKSLKEINNSIINVDISDDDVNNAKELVKKVYTLYLRNIFNDFDFEDIPQNTSEEEYSHIIEQISCEDIKNFHKYIVANSEKNLTLQINKDSYAKNINNKYS